MRWYEDRSPSDKKFSRRDKIIRAIRLSEYGELFDNFCVWWIVLFTRPFFKCPCCKGKGGHMSGYYEPEWSECSYCDEDASYLYDRNFDFFIGRISFSKWLKAKFYMINNDISDGLPYYEKIPSILDQLECSFGKHDYKVNPFCGDFHPRCKQCFYCEEDDDDI